MAIELPMEVEQFLQFIGINFPMVNEDAVRAMAQHVREFSDNVANTHQDATNTINAMSAGYQGSSYDALVQKWAEKSNAHMTELHDACGVVATALDVGADYIIAQKVAAIAELVAMAVAFVADQAAAVVTFGLAEAALALIEEGAEKLCEFLEQQLTQYIIGEILEAAIKPLSGVIEKAMSGFVFQAAEGALGVSGGSGGSVGASFMVHPQMLEPHLAQMQTHGETMVSHAQALTSNISSLNFER
jgi:uncharacterized protein YukE